MGLRKGAGPRPRPRPQRGEAAEGSGARTASSSMWTRGPRGVARAGRMRASPVARIAATAGRGRGRRGVLSLVPHRSRDRVSRPSSSRATASRRRVEPLLGSPSWRGSGSSARNGGSLACGPRVAGRRMRRRSRSGSPRSGRAGCRRGRIQGVDGEVPAPGVLRGWCRRRRCVAAEGLDIAAERRDSTGRPGSSVTVPWPTPGRALIPAPRESRTRSGRASVARSTSPWVFPGARRGPRRRRTGAVAGAGEQVPAPCGGAGGEQASRRGRSRGLHPRGERAARGRWRPRLVGAQAPPSSGGGVLPAATLDAVAGEVGEVARGIENTSSTLARRGPARTARGSGPHGGDREGRDGLVRAVLAQAPRPRKADLSARLAERAVTASSPGRAAARGGVCPGDGAGRPSAWSGHRAAGLTGPRRGGTAAGRSSRPSGRGRPGFEVEVRRGRAGEGEGRASRASASAGRTRGWCLRPRAQRLGREVVMGGRKAVGGDAPLRPWSCARCPCASRSTGTGHLVLCCRAAKAGGAGRRCGSSSWKAQQEVGGWTLAPTSRAGPRCEEQVGAGPVLPPPRRREVGHAGGAFDGPCLGLAGAFTSLACAGASRRRRASAPPRHRRDGSGRRPGRAGGELLALARAPPQEASERRRWA